MGLRINTNISSINAQRNLANTTARLGRSLERLSSGLRITRASDDPAGLAISESFRAEIRSLEQAQRNALDGVSLLQVHEGALNEVSAILIRMRELAVQAANGSLGDNERSTLDEEFQSLGAEITRITQVTNFNGTAAFDGSISELRFQVGTGNDSTDRIVATIENAINASTIGLASGTAVSSVNGALSAIARVDNAIAQIASTRASVGTLQARLESTIRSLAIAVENTAAAESRIRDVDVASETAELTRNQVLQQAGVSVLAQANLSTSIVLSLLQ